jgi:hypothetical protein
MPGLPSPYPAFLDELAAYCRGNPGLAWYFWRHQLKAYPMDGRDQFLFITDLTIRSREILAELGAVQARPVAAAEAAATGDTV